MLTCLKTFNVTENVELALSYGSPLNKGMTSHGVYDVYMVWFGITRMAQ